MPLFNLRCSKCGEPRRALADDEKEVVGLKHVRFDILQDHTHVANLRPTVLGCQGVMEREAIGPTTAQKEILDNGAMTRRLERFADAERLHKERALNADPLAGGVNRLDPRER